MITVDPASSVAPFDQIRHQIADQIRSGELDAGRRLPSIRQLAADLRVAPGTVAKAYSLLESEGLLETSRARGTRVTAGHAHSEQIQRAAGAFVDAAGDLSLEQLLSAARNAWSIRHSAP